MSLLPRACSASSADLPAPSEPVHLSDLARTHADSERTPGLYWIVERRSVQIRTPLWNCHHRPSSPHLVRSALLFEYLRRSATIPLTPSPVRSACLEVSDLSAVPSCSALWHL